MFAVSLQIINLISDMLATIQLGTVNLIFVKVKNISNTDYTYGVIRMNAKYNATFDPLAHQTLSEHQNFVQKSGSHENLLQNL